MQSQEDFPAATVDGVNLSALIAALIAVESGGNPNAVGDGGRSHGILQIGQAALTDVNQAFGTRYTLRDVKAPHIARWVCRSYLMLYCGANATAEEYARTWNGGPRGPQKTATEKYWAKVQRELKRRAHGAEGMGPERQTTLPCGE